MERTSSTVANRAPPRSRRWRPCWSRPACIWRRWAPIASSIELDVYVKVTNPGTAGGESLLYTGARNRVWTRWNSVTGRLGFEYLHIPGNLPSTFDDAIRWNGSRADIWGVSGGNVWQAYDQFSN